MPLVAKFALPCDADPAAEHPAFDEAARGGHTLFTAAPSYLLTEGLSAALQPQGRRIAWVRLGPEDRDPGTFLLSLIAAARPLQPDFGRRTVELMRRQPGPIAGWPRAVSRLAEELQELLATPSAVVLQHVHHLGQARPTLDLLGCHLLPALSGRGVCILTSSQDLLKALAYDWLTTVDVDARRALGIALHLGYSHVDGAAPFSARTQRASRT